MKPVTQKEPANGCNIFQLMSEHPPMPAPSFNHLHIFGPPRSGTTLMLELMRTCYDWDWAPEKETSVAAAPLRRTGRCLTKTPGRGNHIRSILLNPNIWLIYCQRDPRDIVCSRHGLAPDKYWANLAQWRQLRRRALANRHHPRLIIVQYEQLVRSPNQIQQQINARISWLRQTATFSQYQKTAKPSQQSLEAMRGLRPIETSGIGRWKQNLPRLAGQLQIHGDITGELIEDGYETNNAWLKALEAVTPDLSPGYWSEKPTIRQYWRRKRIISQDIAHLVGKHIVQKFL